MSQDQVCLFFFVNGKFLIHGCDLENAEHYGDFLVYSGSHFEVWEKHYAKRYGVDFDYFPRGRVAYRKTDGVFQILYDKCLDAYIQAFAANYTGPVILGYDEHYQCHKCNPDYVI